MSKDSKRYNPGFLLLELLVAIALMAIIWVVIARYQNSAIQVTCNAQQRMKAIHLARMLLNSSNPNMNKTTVDGFTVTWNKESRPLIVPSIFSYIQDANSNQFNLVTVCVAWEHNGHIQSVQLTSGMVIKKETA